MRERCRVQQLPHGRYLNLDLQQYEEWINGQRWGRMTSIHEDDQSYSDWRRGVQHGIEFKFDPKIECKTLRYFEHGLQAGWEETWLKSYRQAEPEDELCSLSQWSNGQRHGLKLCFSARALESYDEWQYDQRHGHYGRYSHSRNTMIWTKAYADQFCGPELCYKADSVGCVSLLAEEKIHNGFRIGYHKNSQLRYIQFFCDGLLEGTECFYAENGQLVAAHEWLHGKRNGVWLEYTPNGELKSKACWSHGLPVGIHYEWYPKRRGGGIKSLIPHNDGKRNGLQMVFYSTSKLKSRTEWHQGQLHGTCRSFFLDGQPCMEVNWRYGQKHGIEREWCNGVLILEKGWRKDKHHGTSSTFNRTTGNLESEVRWHRGQLDGLLRAWNEDGILIRQQSWVANKKQGLSQRCHGNGQLRCQTEYNDGLRHGSEEHFDTAGELIVLRTWKFGKQEDLELVFDTNQDLVGIYTFQSGLRHGFSWTAHSGNIYYLRGCPIPDKVLKLVNTQFRLDPELQSPLVQIGEFDAEQVNRLLQPPVCKIQSPNEILALANIDWTNLGYFCPKLLAQAFAS